MKTRSIVKKLLFTSIILSGLTTGCVCTKQNLQVVWSDDLQPIPLSAWGSPDMAKPDDIDPMKGIKRITVHHDGFAVEPIETDEQIRKRLRAVRDLHQKRFADIGYHFIVDPLGRVWSGRPLEFQGAHVAEQNEHNVGILVLGNYDENEKPTPEALNALYSLIKHLQQSFNIKSKRVYTHCEFNEGTLCPGKHLQTEMINIRKKL